MVGQRPTLNVTYSQLKGNNIFERFGFRLSIRCIISKDYVNMHQISGKTLPVSKCMYIYFFSSSWSIHEYYWQPNRKTIVGCCWDANPKAPKLKNSQSKASA